MIRAGFVQMRPEAGEVSHNLDLIADFVAKAQPADLLVFPELATTGYELIDRAEALSLAEPFREGATSERLRTLAAEHGTTIVCGYAERDGDAVYNACQLVTPNGGAFNYRKLHLFDREKDRFDPGDAPPPVVETPAGRVGLMICFDWFFPEVARGLALAGAQIVAHPSNLVLQHCQRAMYARSVENRVYTVTANRYGTESRAGRNLTFTGASQVLSPAGEMLAQADTEGEMIGVVDIDPGVADSKRVTDGNDLFDDRRPEFYRSLTE